nr:hypothetical protein [Thermomonospora umbrina]
MAAFGVDDDGADFPALDVSAGVEVAEGCSGDGAAVFGFVGHLGFDVVAADADLKFVGDGHDALHGVTEVAVTEVFFGGDEGDAHFGEVGFGGEFFEGVSEGATHHVDDDVADGRAVFLLALLVFGGEVGQHLLEGDPLFQAGGGAAGFYEFPGDADAEGFGFLSAVLALGGDGVAFGVVVGVGVHLLFGGDAEVEDGLFGFDTLLVPGIRLVEGGRIGGDEGLVVGRCAVRGVQVRAGHGRFSFRVSWLLWLVTGARRARYWQIG